MKISDSLKYKLNDAYNIQGRPDPSSGQAVIGKIILNCPTFHNFLVIIIFWQCQNYKMAWGWGSNPRSKVSLKIKYVFFQQIKVGTSLITLCRVILTFPFIILFS